MQRDLKRLTEEQFDLVVIGCGIHGAAIAKEASNEGLRVALVEKCDFGHSASANSLKIIHGGLRYLQHFNLKRMRESIISRRSMMQLAPHLVRPLQALMPTIGHGLKGPEVMRLALFLYDIISLDKNKGLAQSSRFPWGYVMSKGQCLEAIGDMGINGMNGAAVWYDAIAVNTERLVLEYVLRSVSNGAVAANYLEAEEILVTKNQVSGVTVRDVHSRENFMIKTRMIANCGGGEYTQLSSSCSKRTEMKSSWAQALNIVVKKKLFIDFAVGLEGQTEYRDKDAVINRGKRLFFFVPWRKHYTMIGTVYRPHPEKKEVFPVSKEEILTMVDEVNGIHPKAGLSYEDVTFYHAGLVPMSSYDAENPENVQLDKATIIVDHGKQEGPQGMYSVKSVKYTTAPQVAAKLIKMIPGSNIATAEAAPGTEPKQTICFDDSGTILSQTSVRQHLQKKYGSGSVRLMEYIHAWEPGAGNEETWVSLDPPLLTAEVDYFIDEEMAKCLGDVVFRRSDLGSAECPPETILTRLADMMATRLDWDEERKVKELEMVYSRYEPLERR
jgi:glycerol-3-phosphate dehydrogenase